MSICRWRAASVAANVTLCTLLASLAATGLGATGLAASGKADSGVASQSPASAATCGAAHCGTIDEAQKDLVLRAMLAELDRSKAKLVLAGFQRPFFIQYRIEEIDDYQTRGDYGASLGEAHRHQRVARVTVRVGDYKTDSSTPRGDGSVVLATLDNDELALRADLWEATDTAYKQALAMYARKEAALKQVQTLPQEDDFSHEKPVIVLEPVAALDPAAMVTSQTAPFVERMARASGLYRTDATLQARARDVQYSTATFHARALTTWLVNSEGTIVRKGTTSYEMSYAVGTQAADGMHLDRSYGANGTRLSDLDSAEAFDSKIVKLVASLADLKVAPLVDEEYHGPVLLSADAATDVMHDLLSGSVIALRPALGTEARTQGPFASSLHARVMPDSISVVDNPLLSTWQGKGLIGSYDVDDEGVPAEKVSLVTGGMLQSYLIGRQPVRDFPQSNGHGRAPVSGTPQPSISVLQVTADKGLTDAELNQNLLSLAKDRGIKSVYFVATMGPEMTPRLLYKMSADGTRQLVRGATLDDVDLRALRSSVLAAGKEPFVTNYSGAVSTTVMAPALLLDDVTVKRANEKNDKLPFYPPPQ